MSTISHNVPKIKNKQSLPQKTFNLVEEINDTM